MFIDQEWKKDEKKIKDLSETTSTKVKDNFSTNKALYLVVLFVFLISAVWLFLFFNKEDVDPGASISHRPTLGDQASTTHTLPLESSDDWLDQYALGTSTAHIKAEDLSFGHFYEQGKKENISPSFTTYELPINVKSDVENYYDISRRIKLDQHVNHFNNNGFAIIENQFSDEADDFFSMYRTLIKREIPIVITSDFLIYYYQNILKNIYSDIEKNVFYDNLWEINKKFYDIALARYRQKFINTGIVNDPVLEGMRLEVSYFAVALALLKPLENQVNKKANLINPNKFVPQESDIYNFELPIALREGVEAETEFIRDGRKLIKSPIFLYKNDYSRFSVPTHIKGNAKLNNFYLTLRWLESVFPLHYINEDCLDCLLDYDDWLISMAASAFITEDFLNNQELKNQWAVIYKFTSFFTGLRQELTYLHWAESLNQVFGDNHNLEYIFSNENSQRRDDLIKLQSELSLKRFDNINGGLDRDDINNKPKLGMRLLQEPYWPNDFFFKNLTGQEMIFMESELKGKLPETACQEGAKKRYRCRGFGLDIINATYPLALESDYYLDNINYIHYDNRLNAIRGDLEKFDKFSWNDNIYWLGLDISRKILAYDWLGKTPSYASQDNWQAEKGLNTALGTWVNLHLPGDVLGTYVPEEDGNNKLGAYVDCNLNNYIEPNLKLIDEIVIRNNMIIKMLIALKINQKTNAPANELKELNIKLESFKQIIKKELIGEVINIDDCRFISDFVTNLKVEVDEQNIYEYELGKMKLNESLNGLKLLGIVNSKKDKKSLILGPIFNYKESFK